MDFMDHLNVVRVTRVHHLHPVFYYENIASFRWIVIRARVNPLEEKEIKMSTTMSPSLLLLFTQSVWVSKVTSPDVGLSPSTNKSFVASFMNYNLTNC